ncbi:MAG TPA: biotin transporter BioY [Vicinamibacterales bacterium]|nr:biotin transporter BioY [Vicinamibacterales bacterium]
MIVRAPSVVRSLTIVDRIAAPAAELRVLAVLFVTALTAALSQVSFPLPFTPVPFTLQPMVVLLGGAALGARLGATSQILYLMLGVTGLPVFAHAPELPQGILRLIGPSGGYLMAYPLAALVTGWLAERGLDRRLLSSVVAMAAGLGVVFGGGALWLAKDIGLPAALAVGVYPFLLVDVLKIAASAIVLPVTWRWLRP